MCGFAENFLNRSGAEMKRALPGCVPSIQFLEVGRERAGVFICNSGCLVAADFTTLHYSSLMWELFWCDGLPQQCQQSESR